MIGLKEILTEGMFDSDRALKPYEKLISSAVVSFMCKKYGINPKIIVKKVDRSGFIGDVALSDNSVNNHKFYLNVSGKSSVKYMIASLIHELTHVKQILQGELLPSKDWKHINWNGKEWIDVKSYNKIVKTRDWASYNKFPWEKEAISNQMKLPNSFLSSVEWNDLKGKDDNLDFIINNI